ncbi:hypothetical protein TraAM80_07112 [Trypanosoma rangeli]|uniref:Uncharacterized protein n=1 Tax=Trypanosoma rangeli TaxID=5698 RepID=A0A3R7K3U8_TRYRA|nr:uncharacterized protein TraAM80_07112 [Trypanosoma rangeli]RNF01251.1 hypothetical protein TraAM80_07112 [Trypanosoma rangeli]|eukprot:RNF01251.1 hypothetical protein TraAM80_07112 [Trypanosoma rangeli]
MQLEPEGGNTQDCVDRSVDDMDVTKEMSSATLHDPHSETAPPAGVQHYLTNSDSSLTKYTSSSSLSSSSSKQHASHPSVAATPLAESTMSSSDAKRRIRDNEETNARAPHGRNAWFAFSNGGEILSDTVDLWKIHEVTPSAKKSKAGNVDSSTPSKWRLSQSPSAQSSTQGLQQLMIRRDSKGVLWHRPSQENYKNMDHGVKKSGLLSSEEQISGTEAVSPFLTRGQLLKKIAEIKDELSSVRRAKRVLEASSRASQRSSQKGKSRRIYMDLYRLERENEHLQYLLDLGVIWAGCTDLPLRIAEEELRYALDELNREKRRRRELWTDNRRNSILFTEMMKHQQPTREKIARQYREGRYDRLNLQTKVASLQEKISATRETSNHLSKQIRQLEESIQGAGLTHMKPEEYTTMQYEVKKNAKQIERLTDSVAGLLAKVECHPTPCTHLSNEVTPNVYFPGRDQMEAMILKLIRQVEQKESQINSLRQSFVLTGSTVPKSKGSLARFASRKQLLSENRRMSSMRRLSSSKKVNNAGPPSSRQTNTKDAAYNAPLSKVEITLGQQQCPKGEGKGVNGGIKSLGAETKRVVAKKLPASSLLKLDQLLPEVSEPHKSGSALFSVCVSSSNSGQRLGSFCRTDNNNVKKHSTLNDGMKEKVNGLSNHGSGLDSLPYTIQNSQSSISPKSFGKSDSSRVVFSNECFQANMNGKEEEADVVQDVKESGTEAPVWLGGY